jgi:hypothetical protein
MGPGIESISIDAVNRNDIGRVCLPSLDAVAIGFLWNKAEQPVFFAWLALASPTKSVLQKALL